MLTSIPGVGALAARVIVAEVGLDMGRFPTAGHLVSSAACARGTAGAPASATPPGSAKTSRG